MRSSDTDHITNPTHPQFFRSRAAQRDGSADPPLPTMPPAVLKDTNPKDLVGMMKAALSLVPSSLIVCAARGFLEGMLKYGRFNWRIKGVQASIYYDAIQRHMAKWWNGQDCDKLTTIHHLDSAIAGLAILRDAMLYDRFNDDRPPCPDPDAMADLIDGEGKLITHLKGVFKDHHPYQYTIADTPRIAAQPSIQESGSVVAGGESEKQGGV